MLHKYFMVLWGTTWGWTETAPSDDNNKKERSALPSHALLGSKEKKITNETDNVFIDDTVHARSIIYLPQISFMILFSGV